jgi:hypothetical protein
LNQAFLSQKSEKIVAFAEAPTIEHIMPQNWCSNWPLPDKSKGLELAELIIAAPVDPRAIATRERNNAVQTIGNLTILSFALNSAQSNVAWNKKKPELMKHSLLAINQSLADIPSWDEATIRARGENLFSRAVEIWPR